MTPTFSSSMPSPPPSKPTLTRASPPNRPEYVSNRIDDPNYIRVFDTTLRDGEQSPGATMTSAEKLIVARQLTRPGVDTIEVGFLASLLDDLDAVRSIAIERVTDEDIEALLSDEIFQPKVIWSLVDVQATYGTLGLSTATVKLIGPDGGEK